MARNGETVTAPARGVTPEPLLDVIAVQHDTKRIRLIATGKTEGNAEAIVMMAVMRLGVDEEFFDTAPTGKYRDGDTLAVPPIRRSRRLGPQQ